MARNDTSETVKRADAVLARREGGESLVGIAADMGISPSRVRQLAEKAKRRAEWARRYGDLSPLAIRAIRETCGAFVEPKYAVKELKRNELERLPNCGRATIGEIEQWLAAAGFTLAD